MLRLKMADVRGDKDAMDKSVASFTELVQKVTGKEDYKFGDLSKSTIDRLSTTIDAIQEGSIGAMDKVPSSFVTVSKYFCTINASTFVPGGEDKRRSQLPVRRHQQGCCKRGSRVGEEGAQGLRVCYRCGRRLELLV